MEMVEGMFIIVGVESKRQPVMQRGAGSRSKVV